MTSLSRAVLFLVGTMLFILAGDVLWLANFFVFMTAVAMLETGLTMAVLVEDENGGVSEVVKKKNEDLNK